LDKSEIVSSIGKGMERMGARVEKAATVQGHNGAKHTFDLLATKGDDRLPVDVRIAGMESVELEELLKTYAKSLDTRLNPAVVVAIPKASADARRAAEAFGMVLIEASTELEIVERVNQIMARFLS